MSANSNVGFARLFFGDAAIVLLLLNNVRHRMVARVFGVSREDSNLVTVVAIGSAAVATHVTATRVRRSIQRHPSLPDTAIGAAVLRGTALGIAGEPSRAVPAFGGLVALALLGRSSRPRAARSIPDHAGVGSRRRNGAVQAAGLRPRTIRGFVTASPGATPQ